MSALTSVLIDGFEVHAFLNEVGSRTGDPASSTALLFVSLAAMGLDPGEPTAEWKDGQIVLSFLSWDDETVSIPLTVSTEGPQQENGQLTAFHIRKVARSVWTLAPSLNVPGLIHAFVVFTDVPTPAPWVRMIEVATSADLQRMTAGKLAL